MIRFALLLLLAACGGYSPAYVYEAIAETTQAMEKAGAITVGVRRVAFAPVAPRSFDTGQTSIDGDNAMIRMAEVYAR